MLTLLGIISFYILGILFLFFNICNILSGSAHIYRTYFKNEKNGYYFLNIDVVLYFLLPINSLFLDQNNPLYNTKNILFFLGGTIFSYLVIWVFTAMICEIILYIKKRFKGKSASGEEKSESPGGAMAWTPLENPDALNTFVNEFIWHDAFIKEIKIFLPVYATEDGVAGEGAKSTITLIVSDGNGEAWEFLFMNVSEHNLNAQSCLDDSFAKMNSLQNEVTWHWEGEYIKAEKVLYRKRPAEILIYKHTYSYPNLYSADGSIDLNRTI